MATFIGGSAMLGRAFSLPIWVQDAVTDKAAKAGMNLHFSDMQLVLGSGWHPRVRLVNLDLKDLEGGTIAHFSNIETNLAISALIYGTIKPLDLEISGAFARLRRSVDGRVTLSGGGLDVITPQKEARNMSALIEQLDNLLLDPQLDWLKTVQLYGLALDFEDARAQKVWTADGGRIRMVRADNDLQISADLAILNGDGKVSALEVNYNSQIGVQSASFGVVMHDVRAQDIATHNPALAWFSVFNAPISGAIRTGISADGNLLPLNATLEMGAGAVQPDADLRPIPFRNAKVYFNYTPSSGVMHMTELSVRSDWFTGRMEGQAVVSGAEEGRFDALVGQIATEALTLNPFDLYEEPVQIDGASMDFRLTLDPFRIQLGEAVLHDQGQMLNASGDLRAETGGWRFALDTHIDAISPARVLALWPKALVSKTRDWLAENLTAGQLSSVNLALRGAPGAQVQSHLSFDFSDAEVRYVPSLAPIVGGFGHANLAQRRFAITLDSGHVTPPQGGDLDLAGSSFIVPDVTVEGATPAVVRLRTSGTLHAALSLLDQQPLGVMSGIGLPVDFASGTQKLSATLSIPLIKDLKNEDVDFNVTGTVRDMFSETLVPSRQLRASELVIWAENDKIRIAGPVELDGIQADTVWSRALEPGAKGGGQVRGTLAFDASMLGTLGIPLAPDMVSGQTEARFVIDLPPDAPPYLSVHSDLQGLRLALDALGWRKAVDTPGQLNIGAALGRQVEIDKFELITPDARALGTIELAEDGAFARADFNHVYVGDWINTPVSLQSQGLGKPVIVSVLGGAIDLRDARFNASGSDTAEQTAAIPIALELDRLQITDTIAITNFRGNFVAHNGFNGGFTGQVNDGARVSGRIVPRSGRSAIRIQSSNAGRVFSSAQIIHHARGGEMDLSLLPTQTSGHFDGLLKITNTRVKDAPAIADLLSAISIIGLLEQLSGDGILFSEVEARFRLSPSALSLTKASAVGPSMGISMDGRYETEHHTLDVQGVISPVYLLNGVGALLSRKGEGLFGFNYRLTGQIDAPRVFVNPLSALTPGLLRDIFRTGSGKSEEPGNELNERVTR